MLIALPLALAASLSSHLAAPRPSSTLTSVAPERASISNGRFIAVVSWRGPFLDVELSHTRAWSESSRVLELGTVELDFQPPAMGWQATLNLDECRLELRRHSNALELQFFVEQGLDVLHVVGSVTDGGFVTVNHSGTREARALHSDDFDLIWAKAFAPAYMNFCESGDVIVPELVHQMAWYHRNETSIVPFELAGRFRPKFADVTADRLLHRTSGVWIGSAGFVRYSDSSYGSGDEVSGPFHIVIAASCAITKDAQSWVDGIRRVAANSADADAARARTAAWWREHGNGRSPR